MSEQLTTEEAGETSRLAHLTFARALESLSQTREGVLLAARTLARAFDDLKMPLDRTFEHCRRRRNIPAPYRFLTWREVLSLFEYRTSDGQPVFIGADSPIQEHQVWPEDVLAFYASTDAKG